MPEETDGHRAGLSSGDADFRWPKREGSVTLTDTYESTEEGSACVVGQDAVKGPRQECFVNVKLLGVGAGGAGGDQERT